jgi:tetratricopeptide (TPR) repeat protein
MQWTSIATGKRAWQHRVCHPLEPAPDGTGALPVSAARRRSLALWEMLVREGKRSLVVGWPATHGQQTPNLRVVSDRFAEPTAPPGVRPWPPAVRGTYWPEGLRSRFDALRMSPEDIQADVISRFVPTWKNIDQKRDRRLGQLRLFLAADFSYQTAMARLLTEGSWDFAAVRFPGLGAISQVFLPFHQPHQKGASDEEFLHYRGVIRGACRMLDWLLRDLLQAAGRETAVLVVSAHGARRRESPASNPRPEDPSAWKSPYGIFAACGSGFARDALVYGARVLDVAPTVLAWFGLPIGDDMEGRILIEGFAAAPEVRRVGSWETAKCLASTPSDTASGAPEASPANAALQREAEWNLAQSCLDGGRYAEALPVLQRLFRAFPERTELGHALFQCQLALRRIADAEQTLEVVLETLPAGILSLLPRAELCAAKGDFREARRLVDQARHLSPTHPDSLRRLGLLLLRLREWNALEELAKRALELNENEPLAWLGLAEAQLRKGQAADAEQAALRAIGLNYFLPQAHFVLARALVAQSKWDEARQVSQTLLRLQPENRTAATYFRRIGQG